jgi:hypothetical protein
LNLIHRVVRPESFLELQHAAIFVASLLANEPISVSLIKEGFDLRKYAI